MSFRLIDECARAPEDGDAEIRRLRQQLESGAPMDKQAALARLIALRAETVLTELLGSKDPLAAQLATSGLWECWLNEAGPTARRKMEEGIELMNGGDPAAALDVFTQLVKKFPDWAEALNKQATALYLLGNARLSLKVCRLVVELKPNHFGAWNGMALCAAQLEKWPAVLEAAREALRLQPQAQANLDLIQLAQAKLRERDQI
jgi:tetratricopeptide (TPR) repeat protein